MRRRSMHLRQSRRQAISGLDAPLYIGSLVQIMPPCRLQQSGHKPIVLMGGGTTRIGDPTA
jgi:tyrosyl-tRNA synthetase